MELGVCSLSWSTYGMNNSQHVKVSPKVGLVRAGRTRTYFYLHLAPPPFLFFFTPLSFEIPQNVWPQSLPSPK